MKPLKLLLVAIILLSCQFLYAARGSAGPGGSAGGDTAPDFPISAQQVIEYISYVKQPLRYALNYQETVTTDDTHYAEFFKPHNGKTPQELMETLKFVPKVDGPCFDKLEKNATKDASAINTDPLEICISVDQLVSKATINNGLAKIVGLAAHELVHRVLGYSDDIESFARAFQANVEAAYQGDDWQYKYINDEISNQMKSAGDLFSYFQKYSGQSELTCAMAVSASASFDQIEFADTQFTSHMLQILPQSLYDLTIGTAMLHAFHLGDYCAKENMPEKVEELKFYFGRTNPTTQDYAQFRLMMSQPTKYFNEPISYIAYHDDGALDMELDRTKTGVTKFQEALAQEKQISSFEDSEAKAMDLKSQTARSAVELARTEAAQKKPAEDEQKSREQLVAQKAQALLNNAVVNGNSVPSFDAKGFAMALEREINADQVIIEDVKPEKLLTLPARFAERTAALDRRWFNQDDGIYGDQVVTVRMTVVKSGVRHTGQGPVWVGRDNGKQIAWFALSSTGWPCFTWWDQFGEKYDPHLDGKFGPSRQITLNSQFVRENYRILTQVGVN